MSTTETHDYYCHFLGHGLERELLCPSCGENGPNRETSKVWICETCFVDREDGGRDLGDWGAVTFPIRDASLRLTTIPAFIPADLPRLATIVPLPAPTGSHWLALTTAHDLVELDFSIGAMRLVCAAAKLGLAIDQELSLGVSPAGDFVAVMEAKRSNAMVVDLATGQPTMRLNRGDYYTELCRYSVAFFSEGGRTRLVHATDWNRLDISDPRTGELLTSRGPTSYQRDEQRPPHYLDYFHAGLAVSPDQEWIADNGWVWQPCGVIRTWNLRQWITHNVWESEDGSSARAIVYRDLWDGALCWVGPQRLAVWGLGDTCLRPAVRILDVADGAEAPPLIGPFGPTQPAQTRETAQRNHTLAHDCALAFDEYLFAWSPAAGLSAWDIADSARVLAAPELCPLAYHHGTREFLSRDSAGSYHLSKLVAGEA